MFRNAKMILLVTALVLAVGAVATSALTSVTIDRDLTVALNADNDTGAAVKISCVNNSPGKDYSAVCEYDGNGILSLALHKAVNSNGTIGLNRNATFQIGAAADDSRVLAVTNNSDSAITVYFDSTAVLMKAQTLGTTLTNADAGSPVGEAVAAGTTKEFFFLVNTPNSAATSLSGTLQIR